MAVNRIVVLASGRGSNFAAIARAIRAKRIRNAKVVALLTNNPSAGALAVAKKFKIPSHVITPANPREVYDENLRRKLAELKPDWVVLAGYLRLLPSALIRDFPNRMLNIHPSLLPSFKGLAAVRQALEAGVQVTGCTVHFVSDELDSGTIVAQTPVDVKSNDTEATLIDRLLKLEHATYVDALAKILNRPYRIEGNRLVWLANRKSNKAS